MMSDRSLRLMVIILLSIFLIAGTFLLNLSFYSYVEISRIVNLLATDGRLESFTLERFEKIVFPFRVVGLCLLVGFGLGSVFWKATKGFISWTVDWILRNVRLLLLNSKQFISDVGWKSQSRLDKICLVGFTLLSILPRVSVMDTLFMHDESYTYIAFASGSLWQTISDYHLPNNHVFFSVILNLTARILGNEQWILRIPTVLFGVLMVPVMYLFAKKLYGRETAIISSVFVALFPEFIQRSTQARGYILLALIALIVAGLAAYVRTKKNIFAWLMIVLLSALGFFTIPTMLFPFGFIFLWLFLSGVIADFGSDYPTRWDFFKYWFIAGIGAAGLTVFLYSPILLSDAKSLLNNNFVAPLDASTFLSITRLRLINTWDLWMDPLPVWLVLILVAGLGVALLFHGWYANHKIPTQIAFVIWVALIMFILRPNMEPRMWSIVFAFMLIWCAVGIAILLQRMTPGVSITLRQSILTITMFGVLLVKNVMVIPDVPDNWSKETNLERVTAYFVDHLNEGDLVVIGTTNGPMLNYQFAVNGLSSNYFFNDAGYQSAYVVVFSSQESLESVVDDFGPSNPEIDLDSVQLIEQFGNYQIYISELSQ